MPALRSKSSACFLSHHYAVHVPKTWRVYCVCVGLCLQGRRNPWTNWPFGPPKFCPIGKKDKMCFFFNWPLKVTYIPTSLLCVCHFWSLIVFHLHKFCPIQKKGKTDKKCFFFNWPPKLLIFRRPCFVFATFGLSLFFTLLTFIYRTRNLLPPPNHVFMAIFLFAQSKHHN